MADQPNLPSLGILANQVASERETMNTHAESLDTKAEREANDFAADALVPPEYRNALLALPRDSREVIRFARKIGVAPGIVVGQLQHFKKLTHRQLNTLKRRFQWGG